VSDILNASFSSGGSCGINKHVISHLVEDIRKSKADINWHKFKMGGIEPGHLKNKDV